jgi:hypothetical protein
MDGVKRYITKKLKLKVNETKSAVAQPKDRITLQTLRQTPVPTVPPDCLLHRGEVSEKLLLD